jgi:hypothetical protein
MKHLKHSVRRVTTTYLVGNCGKSARRIGSGWRRPSGDAGVAMTMALTIGRTGGLHRAMAVSGRWTRVRTLGHDASEAEVFLAADQTSDPRGGGGSGSRTVVVSLFTGERRSANSAGQGWRTPAAADAKWGKSVLSLSFLSFFLSFFFWGNCVCRGEGSRLVGRSVGPARSVQTDDAGQTPTVKHYCFGKA